MWILAGRCQVMGTEEVELEFSVEEAINLDMFY